MSVYRTIGPLFFNFRETIYRKDKPPLGQATLKEEPIQFGLSFEESEAQSATDLDFRE